MANKPELLAPAGSPEALRAAVRAGADAVYVGGKQFSARMNAHNFDEEELSAAIEYCHARGVRLYVALNTQIYDRKMAEAVRYAAHLYEMGADALIITDLGLIRLLRTMVPGLPLHASTQLGLHNTAAARFCAGLGMTRAVCARELRADDLRTLCADSPIEIEAFVHGALCASQSGGCLFSSMVGGRSGNRGECAQPCRLPYNRSYPLSLKDLCLSRHITELMSAGVASLKIEGRMRGADYVGGVSAVYRTLLDQGRNSSDAEVAYLASLFSRSGFTDGYFTGKNDQTMLGVRTDADKAARVKAMRFPSPSPRAPIALTEREEIGDLRLPPLGKITHKSCRTARFYDPGAVPDTDYFDIIYLPLEHFDGRANGVLLPPVIPPHEYDSVREALLRARSHGARHLMVTGIGQFELAQESGMEIHLDYRFNVYNSYAADFLASYGDVMLSPELTLPQMRDIRAGGAAIVYGRVPLMTLERPSGARTLSDRRGVRFPILREGGRELVLNSVPIYMADRPQDIARAGIAQEHYIFTVEDAARVRAVIKNYQTGAPANGAFTRIKNK